MNNTAVVNNYSRKANVSADPRRLKIAFLHPDLGIGGAERLVVHAALELQRRGHMVIFFTAHHDPNRCLEETRKGCIDIRIKGSFIPPSIGSRLRAPCSIARMAFVTYAAARHSAPFDVIFCDLVPHIIPFIRLITKAKVVFYCHFPDLLLTPKRNSIYNIYRIPLDRLEEKGMGLVDRILVNSSFTANVLRDTFPRLSGSRIDIVYPGIDTGKFQPDSISPVPPSSIGNAGHITILSLNRYSPGKDLGLAIEALAVLRTMIPPKTFSRVHLVFAGGYDERLPENRKTLLALQERAEKLHLRNSVTFLFSVSDEERIQLLQQCHCFIYTSKNEHFGIGIVEAMASGKPVIAVNRGGPLETVLHGTTGFLCDPTPEAFSDALSLLITNPEKSEAMGRDGKKRASGNFSLETFGSRLTDIVASVACEDNHA